MKQTRILKIILALGLTAFTGLLFQNCSDVSLQRIEQGLESSSLVVEGGSSHLPPPQKLVPTMRVVFLVDHSVSMIRQRCKDELDWEVRIDYDQKRGNTENCSFVPGVDPEAKRYELVKQWIENIKAKDVQGDFKFAVLPFSGGIRQRPRQDLGDEQKMRFLEANAALQWSENLITEQATDTQNMKLQMASNPTYLGTSVLLPVLNYAKNLVKTEMDALSSEGKLAEAEFHLVYLSDGIFKPKQSIFERARKIMGCEDCTKPANASHPSCQRNPSSGFRCDYKVDGQSVTGCMWQMCNQYLPEAMKEQWGDPTENEFSELVKTFTEIKDYETRFFEANIGLHFVNLFPEEALEFPWEPNDSYWSMLAEVQTSFPEEGVYEYRGGELPFNFLDQGFREIHYEIENLYAINLNAYVNSYNQLEIDSDTDGIPDSMELGLGYDPDVQRTNGVCLDVITEKFECEPAITVSCFPFFDFDGDGLNQCEEQILKTNERSADSDNDGVIDSHEIIRGLNPNKDDRQDFLNNSGLSAMDSFRRGVHPSIDLNRVLPEYIIDLRINEVGYTSFTAADAKTYFSSDIRLDIMNIPSFDIAGYTNYSYPSRDIVVQSQFDPEQYLLGTDRIDNTNEILFILKIREVQRPDQTSWFMHRVKSNSRKNEKINLLLNEFSPLNVKELERR